MLTNNYHTNPSRIHICFPMKIQNLTDNNADIDIDLITVNNFFAHHYGNDKQLMTIFSTYEIYQYSDAMLKHLPKKSLKKLQKPMLYSKKPVVYTRTTIERCTYNSTTAADVTDGNLDYRITLFQNQLKDEFVYRIPLKHFTDIGKINFPQKIDFKIKCHLETDMKKLSECKKR